ncbi:MAG: hypothetical protein V2B15_08560 [Bacteroidota bacterium]
MKRILLLFCLSGAILQTQAQAQDTTNFVINPQTGRHDFISRVHPVSDTVIDYGTNNYLSPDTLNGVIGHGNTVDAARSMAIGNFNYISHESNILFGSFLISDTTYTVTLGRGLNSGTKLANSRYGSVGLGYFSSAPILYVQSGYEPGEAYVGDIGGVSIGGPELDTLTALQINEHLAGDAFFLKCKNLSGNAVFSVDYNGNADLDGTLTVDSVVCNYVPTIYQVAGDTTGLAPAKLGDMLINTSAGDMYISVGSSRGDWIKLN